MRLLRIFFLVLCVTTSVFAAKGTSHSSSSRASSSKGTSKSSSKSKTSSKSTKASTSKSNQSKVPVKAYERKNGTKVAAHNRSAPNKTQKDNWSTKGNVNPDTGKNGTKNPTK